MYQDIDNHKSPFASPLPNPSTDNLPHIFFAGRIMGILHDITRDIDVCGEDEDDAYGSLKRDDQGELGPRRFERDARFEVRLDEWYRDIPEGLRVSPEIAEAGLSVRQFAISSIEGARVREKSALDDGLGCSDSKTAMKFMLHIMYQTCVLQLHRPRVRLRRMAIGRERAWCLRGKSICKRFIGKLYIFNAFVTPS
ncbi:hypothetical protein BC829DRAFT_61243 [Chytridium lagenaria]|nr:hypothetical protein BC829DRAFT_61243 [Chytridium lagenaria]